MGILIIIGSIATLLLSSWSGPARAATLLVSNQQRTRGDVPVYVTCDQPELSKPVPLGQKTLVEIPGGNANAAAEMRRRTTCMGTFYAEARFSRDERPYVLYDSDKDFTKCKDACFILVTDDGFYRWDEEKRIWGKIFPIIWIP